MKGRLLLAVSWLTLCALVAPAVPPALEPPPAGDGAVPVEPVPEPALEPPPAAAEAPLATPTPPRAPAQSPSLAPAPPPEPDPAPEAVAQAPDPPARDTPIAFAAAPGSVSIRDFAFGPASVTVGVGETVTWSNDDSTEHTATATDGSFDTGLLGRGESGGATFESAGTFSYLCQPHPFMKGTVRVVAEASGDGGSGDAPATDGSGDVGGDTGSSGSSEPAGGLPETGADALKLAIAGLGLLLIGASGMRRSGTRNA